MSAASDISAASMSRFRKYAAVLLSTLLMGTASSAYAQRYTATVIGAGRNVSAPPTPLNSSGEVIGLKVVSHSEQAFLYSNGQLTYLGTLGGDKSYATAINAGGQVTGESNTATSNGVLHAFLYSNGVMAELRGLGASVGNAINASGQVAGYRTMATKVTHAFLSKGTSWVDLGTLGGDNSSAIALNDGGQVVGQSQTGPAGYFHAFLYSNGVMTDLGTLGGDSSGPTAVNESGQVTGYADTAGPGYHAFISDGTSMTDLGTLGGVNSVAYAINASGAVTGQSQANGGEYHGFLYSNGVMIDLGTGQGLYSAGVAINSSGQVTGAVNNGYSSGYALHAFVYRGGVMTDLNNLIPPKQAATFELLNGVAINDDGQIVAEGVLNSTGASRLFLLTPH
jgi:probable HAF family extracellular repeat protein